MAHQASIAARELGSIAGLLVQGVEDGPLPGVLRRDLHQGLPSDPSDCDRVIKEDRSGILWTDDPSLETCFCENDHLRLNGDVERVQNGSQVPTSRLEVEVNFTVPDFAV